MPDPVELLEKVQARLSEVIDPETGADVVHMRLIEGLTVDERGLVCYQFRPSSPVCPLAVPLALSIHQAVSAVDGVTGQKIQVVGYIGAGEVNALLAELEEA